MNNSIQINCAGKSFKGLIVSEKNEMWWILLDNGKLYLLAIDGEGWFCPSLKRSLAALIGHELEKRRL